MKVSRLGVDYVDRKFLTPDGIIDLTEIKEGDDGTMILIFLEPILYAQDNS